MQGTPPHGAKKSTNCSGKISLQNQNTNSLGAPDASVRLALEKIIKRVPIPISSFLMSFSHQHKTSFKPPNRVLWIGLGGIINFTLGCWFLLPPVKESTVYFWFAEFYGYFLLPSLVIFPLGIIMVISWFSRFTPQAWAKFLVMVSGCVLACLSFLPALGTVIFISNMGIIGSVEQDQHFYYLVKHYEDRAPNYSFCKSGAIGFSGQCKIIAWKGRNAKDPNIFIDPHTNVITVSSENPSFIWTNSTPPTCTSSLDQDFVGGCRP